MENYSVTACEQDVMNAAETVTAQYVVMAVATSVTGIDKFCSFFFFFFFLLLVNSTVLPKK